MVICVKDSDWQDVCWIFDDVLCDGEFLMEEYWECVSVVIKVVILGDLQCLVVDLQVESVFV